MKHNLTRSSSPSVSVFVSVRRGRFEAIIAPHNDDCLCEPAKGAAADLA